MDYYLDLNNLPNLINIAVLIIDLEMNVCGDSDFYGFLDSKISFLLS